MVKLSVQSSDVRVVMWFRDPSLTKRFIALCKSMNLTGGTREVENGRTRVKVSFDGVKAAKTTRSKLIARWSAMTCEVTEEEHQLKTQNLFGRRSRK